jgi:sulfur carrier protein ThiS
MPTRLILRDEEFEVKSGMTVRSALLKLGLSPQAILATREGELLTDDEIIKDGEVIQLIAVISGG